MSVLILPPLRDDGQKVPCEVGKTVVNSPEAALLAALSPHISPDKEISLNGQSRRGERAVAAPTPLMAYCPKCGELADFSDALMPEWAMYQCPECFDDFHVSELEPLTARPQQVQLAQAQAARKLPPVVSDNAAKDADYVRLRVAREGGCTRPCGNQPNLPVCTKCFVNLHAGKWTADEANGNFVFGHGVGWEKVLTICSQVHGWIKPSGIN